ncbi:hypothetical protein B296_00024226 [Ensete ventricosum]|uniref:Uncharacterized protein n=1 Tax=Ensete ventricosum TaxID=4639 RepID=A0A426ZUD1_ENSVE|nr:hypothetical protein B296_00024226 [Ensete ventricosum]
MEATTSRSIKSLLLSNATYAHNLSYANDKLRSFWSCLMWICVNYSDSKHTIVS